VFLNNFDNIATLRRLVVFYVNAHNREIPYSTSNCQTTDKMYFGTRDKIPEKLNKKNQEARTARMATNRALSYDACPNREELRF